jgi:hypothetical protein
MRYSIEIIQRTGANALAYGNDREISGEHVKVFTGRDAVANAEAWLASKSEDLIHHMSRAWSCDESGDDVTGTQDWDSVTCGSCKLERPLRPASEAPEYRTPQHVLDMDAKLGAGDPSLAELKARHAARRLEAVRASEEFALATMGYWAKVWREAVILRRTLEDEASQGQGTPKINSAQNGSQGFGNALTEMAASFWGEVNGSGFAVSSGQETFARWVMSLPIERVGEQRDVEPAAPVNAVDIRTEAQYDEGMKLSKNAQTALINAQAYQGAPIATERRETATELFDAGLVGAELGLTRKGTIERARLVQAAEDAAFG